MSTSLDNYPNAYDLQAAEPIKEVLEKYFTHIDKAFEFQEATLEEKKAILQDIALEIDQALHPKRENKLPDFLNPPDLSFLNIQK